MTDSSPDFEALLRALAQRHVGLIVVGLLGDPAPHPGSGKGISIRFRLSSFCPFAC